MEYFAGDMNKFVAFGKEFFGEQVFATIVRNPDTKAQLLQVAKILNGLDARFGDNKKQSSRKENNMRYAKLNVVAENNHTAGSFNRLMGNMNKYTVCFISAWRAHHYEYNGELSESSLPGKETDQPASHNENQKRSKILESLLKKEGLQFNKCEGGYREESSKSENGREEHVTEKSYAVVNNKYNDEDFINLMIQLGTKFDQDSILITQPTNEGNDRKIANVTGDYYITNPKVGTVGSVDMHFDSIEPSAVSDYFTRVFGKSFTLTTVASLEKDVYVSNSLNMRICRSAKFNRLHPHLALKRKYYRSNPGAIPAELRKYIK